MPARCGNCPISQSRHTPSQLSQLRGVDPGDTDVDRKLSELRKEVGLPETSLISEAMDYIRREGTDPATAMSLAWNDAPA